jgi:serine/threonine protein phosphatase 1
MIPWNDQEDMIMIVEDIYEGDDKHRYIIGRSPLLFLGINPSRAKPEDPDPTIRFIENNFDSWIMINIYPQRTLHANELALNFDKEKHNKNIKVIIEAIKKYCGEIIRIVAVWGDSIEEKDYLISCLGEIIKEINKIDGKKAEWYRIGDLSKKGNPKQPIYCLKEGETNIKDMLKDFDINAYIDTKLK